MKEVYHRIIWLFQKTNPDSEQKAPEERKEDIIETPIVANHQWYYFKEH